MTDDTETRAAKLMLSSAESHVTVRPDSVRTGREERRAFLQQRLGVFGLWMFSLSLGFYAVNVAIEATLNADFNWAMPFRPPHGLHLLAAVVCGGLWLVAQGRALSVQALHQIDAIAVVLLCTLYALMGPSFAFRGLWGPGTPPSQHSRCCRQFSRARTC